MQNFFLTAELKTMANLIRRMAEQCPAMLQIEGLTAIQCIVLDYLYENGAMYSSGIWRWNFKSGVPQSQEFYRAWNAAG